MSNEPNGTGTSSLVSRLRTARGLLTEVDGELRYQGEFVDYATVGIVARGESDPRTATIRRNLGHITHGLWNIGAVIDRVQWTYEQVRDQQLNHGGWYMYSALDLLLFHTELRSIYDYIAACIRAAATAPDSVRARSFQKLRNWLQKPDNRVVVGGDLAELVDGARYFSVVRAVRDERLHRGGRMVCFGPDEGIHFQVYSAGLRSCLVTMPEVMFNENVVDFRKYAPLLYADMLVFLEELVGRLQIRFPHQQRGGAYNRGPYETFIQWLDEFLAELGQE